MHFNFIAILVAAVATLPIGFVWYHPAIFGTLWMKATGLSDDKLKKGVNMGLIFGLSIVFAFLIAFFMNFMVIHQNHLISLLANDPKSMDPSSRIIVMLNDNVVDVANNFRTFGHGAFHGLLSGLFLITPVIATNALFERKGFKYIAINAGYWIVCFIIMGGIICAWQ